MPISEWLAPVVGIICANDVCIPSLHVSRPHLAPLAPTVGNTTARDGAPLDVAGHILSSIGVHWPHAPDDVSLKAIKLLCVDALPWPPAPAEAGQRSERGVHESGLRFLSSSPKATATVFPKRAPDTFDCLLEVTADCGVCRQIVTKATHDTDSFPAINGSWAVTGPDCCNEALGISAVMQAPVLS